MSNAPIRIILVDDHKLVRQSWKMLLENNPRFQIIADFDNGESAIEEARQLVPDIMLVDINMSPVNGFTVTERLMETTPIYKNNWLIRQQPTKVCCKNDGIRCQRLSDQNIIAGRNQSRHYGSTQR